MNPWIACLATAMMLTLVSPLRAETPADPGTAASAALHALFDSEWERGLAESPENASYNGDPRFNDRWTDLSMRGDRETGSARTAPHWRICAPSIAPRLRPPTSSTTTPSNGSCRRRSSARSSTNTCSRSVTRAACRPPTASPKSCRLPAARTIATGSARLEKLPLADRADHAPDARRHAPEEHAATRADGTGARVRLRPRSSTTRPAARSTDRSSSSPTASPKPIASPCAATQTRIIRRATSCPRTGNSPRSSTKEYLPRRAQIDRGQRPARWQGLLRFSRRLLHDHRPDRRPDPRDRRQGSRADPREDGKRQGRDRIQGRPARVLHLPAQRSEILREDARRAARTLSGHGQAHRSRTGQGLPHDPAPALWRASDSRQHRARHDDGLLPARRHRWQPPWLLLREPVQARGASDLGDDAAEPARSRARPSLPVRTRTRAARCADFRRTAYFVAYSEGWGLYAEQLGFDMGLYDDPYDHFGQLTYEMWRAVRLVVDTGMHSMGWSRDKAIAYFKENAAKTDQDIVNEVDRYIGTPGQALAYKIGQLKISELRAKATLALGEKFDLRAFNDAVLETGFGAAGDPGAPYRCVDRRARESTLDGKPDLTRDHTDRIRSHIRSRIARVARCGRQSAPGGPQVLTTSTLLPSLAGSSAWIRGER